MSYFSGSTRLEKKAASRAFPSEKYSERAMPWTFKKQTHRVLETAAVIAVDLMALAVAFSLAYLVRAIFLTHYFNFFSPVTTYNLPELLWWLPLLVLACLSYEGLYVKRHSYWRETGHIIKAVTLAFLIALAIVTLAKTGGEVSRTLIVLSWFLSLFFLPVFRYAGKNALAHAKVWRRRVLVLGAGKTGELVLKAINREPYLGYQIAGLLDDDPHKIKKTLFNGGSEVRVLGGFQDAEEIMASTNVHNLIVAAPGLPSGELVELVNRLQRSSESILVIPDLIGMPVMGAEADYFFDERFLALRLKNNLASRPNIMLKRFFDLVAGGVTLLLLLPLMVLIAAAVKLDSPGPVLYAHRRIGRKGKEFICYKFRTMLKNNLDILEEYLKSSCAAKDEWGKFAKLKGNDPRVTKMGKILRKYSLDELPQIFNVIKGDMSLVGPRPYLQNEKSLLNDCAETILLARPGITGLWQVSGRNEIDFTERLYMEAWYVRNWSLWLDITLIIRTFAVVLIQKGAY